MDLRALLNTKIFAAEDGEVTFVHNNNLYGQHIRTKQGNRELLYGHMAPPIVQVGDMVERGQVIGTSGGTGVIDGAHLHFEVWIDGAHVDPMDYLEH